MTVTTPSAPSDPAPATPTADQSATPTPTTTPAAPVQDSIDQGPAAPDLSAVTLTDAQPAADQSESGAGDAKGDEQAKPDEPPATLGAPEGDYTIELPDGGALDAEFLAEVTPVLKELNLSNSAANALAPLAAKLVARTMANVEATYAQQIAQTRAQWAADFETDPEVGGTADNIAQTKHLAAKALDALGFHAAHKDGDGKDVPAHPFRQLLLDSGLAFNVEMWRAWRRVGAAISEPSDLPRPGGAVQRPKRPAEILFGE